MNFTRKLLDVESDTPIDADHSSDLALALLGFAAIIIIVIWRWRAVLCQEWFVLFHGGNHLSATPPTPPPPPGMKKSALQLLPSATYIAEVAKDDVKECAICLTDFADGDLIRVLPQCGHLFHVICVDKWLKTHSSCPSCRQLVTVISKSSPTKASQMV